MNTPLYNYLLRLGDTSLILGHRLSEWCGHGPVLEEDIAMINIALDHVGQSRTLLQYAAEVQGEGKTEDDLAYLRDVLGFKNNLLVEQPNGDFAQTMVRQFFMDAFLVPLYTQLSESKDETLAGVAMKGIKEATYHLRHSSEWLRRMGDGTEESNRRAQDAVNFLWRFTEDIFTTTQDDKELAMAGIGVDFSTLKPIWSETVEKVLAEATLTHPDTVLTLTGSRDGIHTEHLGFVLADMQFLQRTYPGAEW
ncbi:MAG: ring-1,2-phenylacetyl-CoA epoxidase subunit PaaC [Sphingobacteriales bacterium]|jgi:ring-1,2-phenylacetyl-CoA epoxidase subunit PaaC